MALGPLFKDGVLQFRDGALLLVELSEMPQPNCCCGVACKSSSFAEPFTTSIPGNWYLSYGGAIPDINNNRLHKLVNTAGAGMTIGPCIKSSVFTGPFSIALECEFYRPLDGLGGPVRITEQKNGLKMKWPSTHISAYWNEITALGLDLLTLEYSLVGTGTVTPYEVDTPMVDGDILRVEIDGEDEEVEEIRLYLNAALLHTETFMTPKSIDSLTGSDSYAWIEINAISSSGVDNEYDNFAVDIT